MSEQLDPTRLDDCGCCEPEPHKPAHDNAPGRTTLDYRIGEHPTFLDRMLARISRWELPSGDHAGERPLLDALTTRSPDDPAIALLDAWAAVGDVLTFYQERIANEGFLRTATERRSVLELARAIGYELDPGVSAEAYLAFRVDEADGAPLEAPVPAGTQVMSVPAAAGELPQTFETAAPLTAHVRRNAMRLRLLAPQAVDGSVTHVHCAGAGLGVRPGDMILLLVGSARHVKKVVRVREDAPAGRTTIEFATTLVRPSTAVAPGPTAALDPGQERLPLTRNSAKAEVFDKTWTETDLQAFLAQHAWSEDQVLAYVGDLLAESLQGGGEVHVMRERVAFFGHNAPVYASLPKEVRTDPPTATEPDTNKAFPYDWGDATAWPIWRDSMTNSDYIGLHACLERPVDELVAGTWAILAAGATLEPWQIASVAEISRGGFGMSVKSMALTFAEPVAKNTAFTVRNTVAHLDSERLELAPVPIIDDPAAARLEAALTELWLDRMVVGLRIGQAVALQGEDPDAEGHVRVEILFLDEITHSRGLTRLKFKDATRHAFRRDTVEINANVALASHGETVADEVLGNGDGSAAHQAFQLKKPPLTHVAVGGAEGSKSTLTVRVDGVEWTQVDSLYFLRPHDRSYVVRIDDDANARVVFGDGKKGARLPTGQENVKATYRSGIGRSGEVGADSLTLLKKRPFGIREATNPLAASGGDDPEVLADARVNAPLTVMTLGRIVSLRDYEDFVRAYPAIGKAQAVAVWNGTEEVVHITVADAGGDEVVPPQSSKLREAIDNARDPLRTVVLDTFQPQVFFVRAKVLVDAAYRWADVEPKVEAALLQAFGFAARGFGQPVTAAEVLQVIHRVAGVVAVDLDWLAKTEPPANLTGGVFDSVLDAQVARFDKSLGRILEAQLLLIHPQGIELEKMEAPR